MNSVIDPSASLISSTEWQDDYKREKFLAHLTDNLLNIDGFKITKFYWTEKLQESLWKNPPWRADIVKRNSVVPLLYPLFSRCINMQNIDTIGSCKIDPALSCKHGNNEFNEHFMELMHNLINKSENIFLCLGIDNQFPKGGNYVFSCDCHSYKLKPELIKNPNDWFKYISNDLETDSWKHKQNYFPKREFSDRLVNNDWDKFRRDLKSISSNEKMAKIKEIGALVAKINGYRFNSDLSSHNQKKCKSARSIHQAGKKRDTIYLSVDFEKGAFEVCDFDGIHLGEFGFNGKRLQDADTTGKHNIFLQRRNK